MKAITIFFDENEVKVTDGKRTEVSTFKEIADESKQGMIALAEFFGYEPANVLDFWDDTFDLPEDDADEKIDDIEDETVNDTENDDERGLSKSRQLAIDIIDIFEELLAEHDIYIPDEDREEYDEDDEDYDEDECEEACIYGSTYYQLEDEITELLDRHIFNKGCVEEVEEEDDDECCSICSDCEMISGWFEQLLEATDKPDLSELTTEEIEEEIEKVLGTISNEKLWAHADPIHFENIVRLEQYLAALRRLLKEAEELKRANDLKKKELELNAQKQEKED